MGDSMITPSIEYDYLIKFLALGDSGVGRFDDDAWEFENHRGVSFQEKRHFSISIPMDNSIRNLSPLSELIFERNEWFIDRKHRPVPNPIEFICNYGIR